MPRKKALLPRPLDVNQVAYRFVRAAVGEPVEEAPKKKNVAAAKLGAKGGKKGGKARARKLTDEQRAKSATVAALARWKRGS